MVLMMAIIGGFTMLGGYVIKEERELSRQERELYARLHINY